MGYIMGKRVREFLKSNWLLICTVAAVVVGTVVALIVLNHGPELTRRQLKAITFPGEIFLRALNMIILPLIVSSIVCGLADLDAKSSGRMGGVAMAYYFATTVIAAIEGIVCVVSIRPGNSNASVEDESQHAKPHIGDNLMDLIRNMVPNNLIAAAFQKYKSVEAEYNSTINGQTVTLTEPLKTTAPGSNILGLVVFSVLLGTILSRMGDDGLPLVKFFRCINGVVMKMVSLFMYYAPIGILFLILGQILKSSDFGDLMAKLGLYIATVLVGHFIHAVVALPLIFLVIVRKNPYSYIAKTSQALLTAFGTSSSSATLPVTMKCVVQNCEVDPRVAQFVLPIGATINMDGTALYEAVAALFIAQKNNIELTVGEIITVSLTATLASVGAAGIPTAGMVTMLIVLNAVNLPVDDISLLLAVDWFLDRFRTAANVSGDTIGAAVVNKLCRRGLDLQESSADVELRGVDSTSPGVTDDSSEESPSMATTPLATPTHTYGSVDVEVGRSSGGRGAEEDSGVGVENRGCDCVSDGNLFREQRYIP